VFAAMYELQPIIVHFHFRILITWTIRLFCLPLLIASKRLLFFGVPVRNFCIQRPCSNIVLDAGILKASNYFINIYFFHDTNRFSVAISIAIIAMAAVVIICKKEKKQSLRI